MEQKTGHGGHLLGSDEWKKRADKLKELQMLPLNRKILITQTRIMEWYRHYSGNVYVSFSGGKDSTVLLHIAREMYPDIPAVFVNTGLEHPEIREFALSHGNVTELRPYWGRAGKKRGKNPEDVLTFRDVVSEYGYPIISKDVANTIYVARNNPSNKRWLNLNGDISEKGNALARYDMSKYRPLFDLPIRISDTCCKAIKKGPTQIYNHKMGLHPMVATMAEESHHRRNSWIRHGGCNAFRSKEPKSTPMSFWTEQDVLRYIVENGIEICEVYGDIVAVGPDGMTYEANTVLCGGGVQSLNARASEERAAYSAHLAHTTATRRYAGFRRSRRRIRDCTNIASVVENGWIIRITTRKRRAGKGYGTRANYGSRTAKALAWGKCSIW